MAKRPHVTAGEINTASESAPSVALQRSPSSLTLSLATSRSAAGRYLADVVLGTTAVIALGFVFATAVIAVLVNGVEKERTRAVVPAE